MGFASSFIPRPTAENNVQTVRFSPLAVFTPPALYYYRFAKSLGGPALLLGAHRERLLIYGTTSGQREYILS